MSVVSSTLAVGGVVGLVATGLLVGDGGDYRRPFWIGLGVTLLSLALAARVLPHRPSSGSGRVDWWGAPSSAPGWSSCCCRSPRAMPGGGDPPAVVGLPGRVGGRPRRLGAARAADGRSRSCGPAMLADRRTIVPNLAGLMTGVALFASFLAVLQYVQAPAGA